MVNLGGGSGAEILGITPPISPTEEQIPPSNLWSSWGLKILPYALFVAILAGLGFSLSCDTGTTKIPTPEQREEESKCTVNGTEVEIFAGPKEVEDMVKTIDLGELTRVIAEGYKPTTLNFHMNVTADNANSGIPNYFRIDPITGKITELSEDDVKKIMAKVWGGEFSGEIVNYDGTMNNAIYALNMFVTNNKGGENTFWAVFKAIVPEVHSDTIEGWDYNLNDSVPLNDLSLRISDNQGKYLGEISSQGNKFIFNAGFGEYIIEIGGRLPDGSYSWIYRDKLKIEKNKEASIDKLLIPDFVEDTLPATEGGDVVVSNLEMAKFYSQFRPGGVMDLEFTGAALRFVGGADSYNPDKIMEVINKAGLDDFFCVLQSSDLFPGEQPFNTVKDAPEGYAIFNVQKSPDRTTYHDPVGSGNKEYNVYIAEGNVPGYRPKGFLAEWANISVGGFFGSTTDYSMFKKIPWLVENASGFLKDGINESEVYYFKCARKFSEEDIEVTPDQFRTPPELIGLQNYNQYPAKVFTANDLSLDGSMSKQENESVSTDGYIQLKKSRLWVPSRLLYDPWEVIIEPDMS